MIHDLIHVPNKSSNGQWLYMGGTKTTKIIIKKTNIQNKYFNPILYT